MDHRFVRAWHDLEERRRAGEPMPDVLRHTQTRHLIAALAGAGKDDPVAANAIATELLNRQRRAPYLGVLIASVTFLVAIFVVDTIFTGSPLLTLGEASRRGYALAILSAATAGLSLFVLLVWRRRLRPIPWPWQRRHEF